MPTPNPDETEEAFVERCVPLVIEEGTAKDGEQAAAICRSMYAEHKAKLDAGAQAKAAEPADPPRKAFAAKSLSVDLDKRTIRHWITTIDVDDQGEVLLPKGADMSRFAKTRTVFDGHDYRTRSIVGRNIDYQLTERGILGLTRVTPRPPAHPKEAEWFPDTILWLHHTGDLSGWSVGFDPIDRRDPSVKDRAEYGGADPTRLRRVHSKWRMLEYSVAPIPVNEDARNLALQKGWISPRLAGHLAEGRSAAELLRVARPRVVQYYIPKGRSRQEQLDELAEVAVARRLGKMSI